MTLCVVTNARHLALDFEIAHQQRLDSGAFSIDALYHVSIMPISICQCFYFLSVHLQQPIHGIYQP